MSDFIKVGNDILNKPKLSGLEYTLESGKIYNLKWDANKRCHVLQENGSFNLPKKIYELKEDKKFIERILKYYNSENSANTTGVLLSGTKGTGKSVFAKVLAGKSNLPIIIPEDSFPVWYLEDAFKNVNQEICIIFDEFEKKVRYEDMKYFLTFLDGVEKTTKKLVIITCNDTNKLDDNLLDRCSRIRYHRHYQANSNDSFIREIAKDKGISEDKIEDIIKFITKHIEIRSFDNINSFLNEFTLFGNDYTLDELITNMNFSLNEEE